MNIEIETERLLLRRFTDADATAASDNSKQPLVAHYLSDMVLENEQKALEWIHWINKDKFDMTVPFIALAVEVKSEKKCIGLIGVAPKRELDNEIEILFGIADDCQNRGYITEAGTALIKWVFDNTPSDHLVAIVKHDNPASRRVIEKLGFVYQGEKRIEYDGQMTGFHYYQLCK